MKKSCTWEILALKESVSLDSLLSELVFHLRFPFNFIVCILHRYFFLVGNVFAPSEYSHNHRRLLMVTKCYLFMFICFLLAFIASVSFGMSTSLLLKLGFQEYELKLLWDCI